MTVDVHIAVEAQSSRLGLTTNTVAVTGGGMVGKVIAQTTSTAAVLIIDSTSTASSASTLIWQGTMTANQIVTLNWPFLNALTIVPSGSTINVSWNKNT